MARASQEPSLPFTRKHFQWIMRRKGGEGKVENNTHGEETLPFTTSYSLTPAFPATKQKKTSPTSVIVSRFRSILTTGKTRSASLRSRIMIGTIFGQRHGHVNLAFQVGPKSPPVALIELDAVTSALVAEMASGPVRVVMECSKAATGEEEEPGRRLVEEERWRAFCNGRKLGQGARRECGEGDWEVLRAIEPVSTGAGVLTGEEGEVMYMRARFERVVRCTDSEAFYMMSPCGGGLGLGPELSIFFIRV